MSFSSTSLILAWILGITMMEVYLPSGPSSWFDVAGAAGFLALVGLTWAWVETSAVAVGPRARKGWEYLRSIVSKYHIKLGVDFRETPPYPQRFPAPFMRLTLVVAALAILGLMAPSVFPHGLRSQLAGRSSTLYLAITSATWLWASAVGSFSGFISWYYLNDALVGSGAPSRLGSRLRILVPLAALIAVVLAATVIDPSVPVAAIVGILMLGLLSLAFGRTGQIKLVWRVVGATQVFAVGFRWIIAWSGVLCCGVVSATCILMTISGWHGGPAGPTVWIGSATAWLGVLAAATWLWASPIRLLSLALHDPERVRPTAVLFTDRVPSPQVVADLEARGIRVLEQEGDGSLVRVTLDPEANRRQVEAVVSGDDPIWSVHPDDLLTPDVLAELRAIDRSTIRQQLIIGVARK